MVPRKVDYATAVLQEVDEIAMIKLNILDPAIWKDIPVNKRRLSQGTFGLRCKLCGKPIQAGERFMRRGNHCCHEECVQKLGVTNDNQT